MGNQIIRQPDDRYAVFSSVVDGWIVYDATRDEIVEHFAERAANDARRSATRLLDLLDSNERRPFGQFTLTFDDADARHNERHDPVPFGFQSRQEEPER